MPSSSMLGATAAGALLLALLVGCDSDDSESASDPDPTSTVSETTDPTDSPTTDDPFETAPPPPPTSDPVDPDDPETDDPYDPSDQPGDDPSEDPSEDPGDDPGGDGSGELCEVFETAFKGLSDVDFPTGEGQQVTPELVDLFHAWGEGLESASLPDDLTSDERAGFAVMAKALKALPDDASLEDLDAIEDSLSKKENAQAEAASDYAEEHCDLA